MSKPIQSEENIRYLSTIFSDVEKILMAKQVHHNHSGRDRVAVIVEPRCHEWLIPIIRSVMYLLDDTWNLAIFHGTENKSFIEDKLPDWKIQMINLGVANISADEHNKLLMERSFWRALREEHVLIFQTDSCLLRRGIERFIDHDMIGAETLNPHELTPARRGYNGGLSLRRRSAMLECIEKISVPKIDEWRQSLGCRKLPSIVYTGKIAEDIRFFHSLEMLGKKLPDRATAGQFSTEAIYNKHSYAIHGCHKSFFPFHMLRELIESSDLIKIIKGTL